MTVKTIATRVAAVAAMGAAAAGVTSMIAFGATPGSSALPQVRPVVFSAPLSPLPEPPTADQLVSLLTSLADPNVPFANKRVEGIGSFEALFADRGLKKAERNGDLPLSFTVANIEPASAGAATADVTVSGPKLSPPVTKNVRFVNQGSSWMLSHESATQLLQAAQGS
jgi:hypothetical protein